jgi:phospholipid/cholesterol/gamma-HCH transport system permease protein
LAPWRQGYFAGRVGSGIGAVLANRRAPEQIDAIESLSIDSFKFLVVPRVLACVIALPLLTLFMDFSGLLGGFLSEELSSHIAPALYLSRAFDYLQWSNFIAPTLKIAVFGFIIGSVSSYFGYTTDKGAQGVGEAATNSVVVSSLLIIVTDVLQIKCIFFLSQPLKSMNFSRAARRSMDRPDHRDARCARGTENRRP